MKTFKTTQLALIVFLLLCVSSCDNRTDTTQVSDFPEQDCPNNLGLLRTNEIIVRFDKCAFESNKDYIDQAISKLEDELSFELDTVIECRCDSTLMLFRLKPGTPDMDQEERLASANDKLKAEGLDLGSAIYNMNLGVGEIPPNDILLTKSYSPKEYSVEDTVLIAVIDGGINKDLLAEYLWTKPNPVECGDVNGLDLTTGNSDYNNHGSLVSQVITRGLPSEKVKLMDVRIFDENGDGNLFHAACAMSFAIQKEVDIINASWGYYAQEYDPTILGYIKDASINDIVVVSSAGNEGLNNDKCNHFISNFDNRKFRKEASNVIAVAYLNQAEDSVNKHSNRGEKTVSLAAKGLYDISGNTIEGSSYAAARVTRTVALIRGRRPNLNNRQVLRKLFNKNTIPLQYDAPLITNGKLANGVNTSD
jgi:subtilisin family serine protease